MKRGSAEMFAGGGIRILLLSVRIYPRGIYLGNYHLVWWGLRDRWQIKIS